MSPTDPRQSAPHGAGAGLARPALPFAVRLLAVVLAGVGGWYAVGPFLPATESVNESRSTSTEIPSGSTDPQDAAGSATDSLEPIPAPQATAGSSRTDVPTDLRRQLQAFIDATPLPEVERGMGRATVLVRAPDGRPLAGVDVSAVPWDDAPELDASEQDLEEYVRAVIARLKFEEARVVHATSDESGLATLEGLRLGWNYEIEPSATGVRFEPLESDDLVSGEHLEFRGDPTILLTLDVRDRGGVEIAEAWIDLSSKDAAPGEDEDESLAWERAAGPIEVPETARWLRAGVGPWTRIPEPPVGPLVLEFHPTDPWFEIEFDFLAADPIDLYDVDLHLTNEEGGLPSVYADPEDPSSRGAVRAGTYTYELARNWETIATGEVFVGPETSRLEFSVPPLDRRRMMRVQALDPRGRPIDTLSFRALSRPADHDAGTEEFDVSAWIDRSAIAHIFLPEDEEPDTEVGPTPLDLEVHSPLFGPLTVPLELGNRRVRTVRYSEAARAVLHLVGYVGHPAQGNITVQIGDETTDELAPDLIGRVELPPLPPGRHTVRFLPSGFYDSEELLGETWIDLTPGRSDVDVALPVLHDLVVRLDADTEARALTLRATPASDGDTPRLARWAGVDSDGLARFRAVPPGVYSIVRPEGSYGGMNVRVPGAGVVLFAPRDPTLWRAVHVPSNGPFAESGLREGDRILEIDGLPLSEPKHLWSITRRMARGEGSMVLLVDRPSGPMTLEVSLDDGTGTSFDLEPCYEGGGSP